MIVNTVPGVSEGIHVIVAQLRDIVELLTCLWKVRDLSSVTPRSFIESERGTVDPATSICEMLDNVRFR